MGDAFDFWSFSRYARTLNLITPDDEIRRGREQLASLWAAVHDAAPNARCHQIKGNHCDRLKKLILSKAPELESITNALNVNSLWEFPGVITQVDSRSEVVIDNVMFHHGHRSRLGDHMKFNQMSTVVGHSHHGGVVYQRLRDKVIWELNVGHVVDELAVPFQYTDQKLSAWVAGFGVIDSFGPRFNAFLQ